MSSESCSKLLLGLYSSDITCVSSYRCKRESELLLHKSEWRTRAVAQASRPPLPAPLLRSPAAKLLLGLYSSDVTCVSSYRCKRESELLDSKETQRLQKLL